MWWSESIASLNIEDRNADVLGGCAPVTAPGPTRLRGSGFSLLFSITVCVDKWGMHLPHVRQSGEMAALGCPIIEAEAAYPRSSEAIAIMRKLFAIERELPDFRCLEDSAEREAALKIIAASRLEKSRPLMEELAQWMREQNCLPKSKLGGSIRYATNS